MTTEERVIASRRRNPTAKAHQIAKNLNLTAAEVRKWDPGPNGGAPHSRSEAKRLHAIMGLDGLPLPAGRVLSAKPQNRMRELFHTLPRDKGFPVLDLAEEWGVTEDTLAKHARRHGVLRYVPVDGEYIRCILHPDTAKKHPGGE